MLGGIVISFFETVLFCACIILIAWLFVWGLKKFLDTEVDAKVFYWGRAVVGLLCFIAFLTWLFAVLGMGGGLPRFFPRAFSSIEYPAQYSVHASTSKHMHGVLRDKWLIKFQEA